MPTQSDFFDESPALDGPDYVALVIEWDELADDLERQIRGEQSQLVADAPHRWRSVGIAAGITLVAAAAAWGVIHKLRA